jgi:hypothetical protein
MSSQQCAYHFREAASHLRRDRPQIITAVAFKETPAEL